MKTIRLGVIGMSDGNGHPYSWAAIFNGYEPVIMEKCGFPMIPRYLEKQNFPADRIPDVQVSHVWTQDPHLSQHIAKATYIAHVVDRAEDLLGKVDGILLARDDAENHLQMARPFLEAGLPVYVDKPLALSLREAKKILNCSKSPNQIFSCSAFKFAPELVRFAQTKHKIGKIKMIHAFTPKDWDRYAVHGIDPALELMPERGPVRKTQVWRSEDRSVLRVLFQNDLELSVQTCGQSKSPIALRIFGSEDWCDIIFTQTFQAFRNTLCEFVQGIRLRKTKTQARSILSVIELIERGRKS